MVVGGQLAGLLVEGRSVERGLIDLIVVRHLETRVILVIDFPGGSQLFWFPELRLEL